MTSLSRRCRACWDLNHPSDDAAWPGLTKDNVKIEVSDVRADQSRENGRRSKNRKRRGTSRLSVRTARSLVFLPLPEGVKADEAKATFKDGVLEVAMPAAKPEKHSRQLEIK